MHQLTQKGPIVCNQMQLNQPVHHTEAIIFNRHQIRTVCVSTTAQHRVSQGRSEQHT